MRDYLYGSLSRSALRQRTYDAGGPRETGNRLETLHDVSDADTFFLSLAFWRERFLAGLCFGRQRGE